VVTIPVAIMMSPVSIMPRAVMPRVVMSRAVMSVVPMMPTMMPTVVATVGGRGDSGRCDTDGESDCDDGCADEFFETDHLDVLCFISWIRSRS